MGNPRIIGEGCIPEAAAVADVRDAMPGRDDVVLLSHVAGALGEQIPDDATLYNLEPLYDGCRGLSTGYLDVLRKSRRVWDYQARNVAYLNAHGIGAEHVPYGWHPALERCKPSEKDIDVLFFGSMSDRRARIIEELSSQCSVRAVQGVYGAELDALVSRAKVVVNIHFCDEPHPLEVVRLAYLMANGACVVTEPGWEDDENALYSRGTAMTTDVVTMCAALLSDDEVRLALSDAARKTIRSMPMAVPPRQNVRHLSRGLPVEPIYWAIQQHPELWNQHTYRTQHPTSPHHGLDDIWLRYGDPGQDPKAPHESHWHPAADVLGVKALCLDIMRRAGGSVLGGVLITRIPPGAMCKPHIDRGWHADAHDKYAVQITSAPGQLFHFHGEMFEAMPGDLYSFQNEWEHWVTNPTDYERITMIVCVRKEH